MGRHDWYRNKEWNADIETAYRAKLARSRSGRPQYLIIQASCLSKAYPIVALGLIDEYFETGDKFHTSQAFCVRAESYRALCKETEVIAAYKQALDWEEEHPNHISGARINFPKFVVDRGLREEYDYVLDILTSRFTETDHAFPSTRYTWNGICALITFEKREVLQAREFAYRAVRAANETESPFRYHRKVGLVEDTYDNFGQRVKDIAEPSKQRSWLRFFSKK